MRVFCKTHSSDENMNVCSLASIDLTPTLIETIKRRIALFEQCHAEDNSVVELSFYDLSPVWFDPDENTDLGEEISASIFASNEDWLTMPPQSIPEQWKQNTDCDRFFVSAYGDFWFSCCPKHSDSRVTSKTMRLRDLADLTREITCVHCHAPADQVKGIRLLGGAATDSFCCGAETQV